MKLFEYEGKELFAEKGIPIPLGYVAKTTQEIEQKADSIGKAVVLKSQILHGGRGKAGGIRFATSPKEAKMEGKRLLDMQLKGHFVKKVLVEEKLDIEKEFYVCITVDAQTGNPIIMASAAGGMDIEEVAKNSPEKIIKESVNIFQGPFHFQARRVSYKMGLRGNPSVQMTNIILKAYEVFRQYDAELVEINPLVITKEGQLIAADSKVTICDNALYRQNRFVKTKEHYDSELEWESAEVGLNYIGLDGTIGLCCAGAGLTMMTLDLIDYYGGKAANFLEFGGSQYRNAHNALSLVLKNPDVKVVLINVFGLIARADVIAQGLVEAIKVLQPSVPIVASLKGTGKEQAYEIFREQLDLEVIESAEEAVREAVRLGGYL